MLLLLYCILWLAWSILIFFIGVVVVVGVVFHLSGVAGGLIVPGMSSLSSNFRFIPTAAGGAVKVFFDHSFLGDSNFSNSFFH